MRMHPVIEVLLACGVVLLLMNGCGEVTAANDGGAAGAAGAPQGDADARVGLGKDGSPGGGGTSGSAQAGSDGGGSGGGTGGAGNAIGSGGATGAGGQGGAPDCDGGPPVLCATGVARCRFSDCP